MTLIKSLNNIFSAPATKAAPVNTDPAPINFPVEFSEPDKYIARYVMERELTVVGKENLFSTLLACKYVSAANIPGDFVECGCYRGGNGIVAADVFQRLDQKRKIWLYDTFAGMTRPGQYDFSNHDGSPVLGHFLNQQRETHNEWVYASLPEVKNNFQNAGFLNDNVKFIQGDVLETLSAANNLPDKIAVMRLDTDWYESTKIELEVLYPRLSVGGILVIDDYGHYASAKKAVDEYFQDMRPYFQYIDYTARIAIKLK
jgi:O-methyltransferase